VFNVDRTHLASRTTGNRDVIADFRGGTLLMGTAEVRFAPLGRQRVGPFVLAGLAAGVSHPNVNEVFPDRVTNQVRGVFAGGGLDVPLSDRALVFADVRMLLASEGNDGVAGVVPLRVGFAWRF
jgi:hypothetical protein